MKNVKFISLALSVIICFVTSAQEKPYKETKADTVQNSSLLKQSNNKEVITNFRLRDTSSKNEPLFFIDGIHINATQFAKINPLDIKNFKILKGIEATSAYGIRGIKGVYIISSKNEIYKNLTEKELNTKLNLFRSY